MNINSVDLNLLVVFQSIYVTRSVTAAGDRTCMTQSAVSAALKRLRETFGDPLFVRVTDRMAPTALADRLIGPVNDALESFSLAIDHGRSFDIATSERTFHLAMNEIAQLVLLPRLVEAAGKAAPLVRFETVEASLGEARQRMASGQVDLTIGSWEGATLGPSLHQQRLFDETYVAVLRRDHPAAAGLTLDSYMAADHIAYLPSGATEALLQLSADGIDVLQRRRVVLAVAHVLGMAELVASSDKIITLPGRLARAMLKVDPSLCVAALPCSVNVFHIHQQWHERSHLDSGHRWLRELIRECFENLPLAEFARNQLLGAGRRGTARRTLPGKK